MKDLSHTDYLLILVEKFILFNFERLSQLISVNLWQHRNITVLPHISAPTNMNTACQIVANNIIYYRRTGQLPEYIDKNLGY
jgi:glyoxylate/hydroxypyruvate reductase A